jgi:hypothetical protein
MPSSGMLHCVALVRTIVLEECNTSIIKVTRIDELGTINVCHTANIVASSPILVTLMTEALRSSKTSVPTRTTWCNSLEDGILHKHHCENLKSFIENTMFQGSVSSSSEKGMTPTLMGPLEKANLNHWTIHVKVKVTL